MKQLSLSLVLGLTVGAIALSGCRSEVTPLSAQPGNGGGVAAGTPPPGAAPGVAPGQPGVPGQPGGAAAFRPGAEAGVKFAASTDAAKLKDLIASRTFSTRSDPFALLAVERAFDEAQLTERLSQQAGWSVEFEPVEREEVVEPDEPQPYRRLAGVLQSDSVSAIIIMEDGRAEIIWPGRRIPNSEWRVVSIDGDRAILRRAGTKRPRTIEVRLETDPTPGGGSGAGGGGGRGGGTAPSGDSGASGAGAGQVMPGAGTG